MRARLLSLFLRHPAERDETYLQHFKVAVSIGGPMVLAGLACVVHAVLPFWFKTTASRTLVVLADRVRRVSRPTSVERE
ncbi:DUF6356 family protein [Brevundimonas sp.]|uniref:DUF6356 family protein n=1 Tax=Brevundimonas sp. TaxID=1871086 RepID=UPI00289C760A|nr:DUF6356 family protein [Brevundimonas sp.]